MARDPVSEPSVKSVDKVRVWASKKNVKAVCNGVATGLTLSEACRLIGTDRQTWYGWCRRKPEVLAAYQAAKQDRNETLEEEIHRMHDDLPDDCTNAQVSRNRERANNRKWLASVTNPGKYSDKHMIGVQDLTPKPEEQSSAKELEEFLAEFESIAESDEFNAGMIAKHAAEGMKSGLYATMEQALVAENRAQEARTALAKSNPDADYREFERVTDAARASGGGDLLPALADTDGGVL